MKTQKHAEIRSHEIIVPRWGFVQQYYVYTEATSSKLQMNAVEAMLVRQIIVFHFIFIINSALILSERCSIAPLCLDFFWKCCITEIK
jgi:hypothetical protein